VVFSHRIDFIEKIARKQSRRRRKPRKKIVTNLIYGKTVYIAEVLE
jgi:hypothetical protein